MASKIQNRAGAHFKNLVEKLRKTILISILSSEDKQCLFGQ